MNILPKISVPSYRLNVPSTGQEVKYRPYMVKEEKILLIAVESEDPIQIKDALINLIKECCENIDDISSLITCDIEYIFLKLRSVSVGESVDIIKECDKCGKNNEVKIKLNDIKTENLDKLNNLRVNVEDNFVVDMAYPQDTVEDDIIKLVSGCIKTVYYGDDTYEFRNAPDEEKIEFAGNLTSLQFAKLTEVLLVAPFVSYESEYACKECGEKNEVYYTGLIDFFI